MYILVNMTKISSQNCLYLTNILQFAYFSTSIHTVTRTEIKIWLRSAGRSRAWLADRVGVSVQTVNGWLSSGKNIPAGRVLQIKMLMRGEGKPKSALSERSVLVLDATPEEFDLWNAAAMSQGLLVREWAEEVLTHAARCLK